MTGNGNYFFTKGKNAENIVHDLAQKTFLIDWCYLNPLRPDGKELCDLLVVFDDIVIIFQIKDLKLDSNGRYKKPEVEKNLKQLSGAKRALFDLKTPIELSNTRRREKFNPHEINRIYLISVLMGEGEEDFSFIEEFKNSTIHVFTRDFTQIIMNELDTINDFQRYLEQKEKLIQNDKRILIDGGEEELLVYYIRNGKSFSEFDRANLIFIESGSWLDFINSDSYKKKKEADEISYLWDEIIDRNHEGSNEYEKVARELARVDRFNRRFLSKTLIDAHVRARNSQGNIFRRCLPHDNVTYCFLFMDNDTDFEIRRKSLECICWVARKEFNRNKKVIGIATEKIMELLHSYDFALLEIPELTEQQNNEIEIIQKGMNIFVNPDKGIITESEYPE